MSRLPDSIGISTVAWDEWELPRALERAAEYASLVEVYSGGAHSLLSKHNRSVALASGLAFTVHGPYDGLELGSPRERARRAAVVTHRRNLEAAAEIGARCYVVHPDFSMRAYRVPVQTEDARRGRLIHRRRTRNSGVEGDGAGSASWGWDVRVLAALQTSFRELEEVQRDIGVRIAVENMPMPGHSHFHSPADLLHGERDPGTPAVGRGLHLGGLGFVLDAGHAAACGTLDAFLARPPQGFVHVHLHDNKGLAETGDPHLALGDGVVDVAGVLRTARRAGATVVLELGDEESVRRSIAYLELEHLLIEDRKIEPKDR